MVGKRLADLDSAHTVTGTVRFTNQGRARAAQRNYGRLHVYADRATGRLQGAEMCAPAAEHLAQRPAHLGHLEGVGEACAHEVVRAGTQHLCLGPQTAQRRGVQHPGAVALEGCALGVLGRLVDEPEGVGRSVTGNRPATGGNVNPPRIPSTHL